MRILAAAIFLLPWNTPSPNEPLRLPVTADTQLSMSHGEERLNHGTRSALRLKGIEDLSLFDLDVTPLKGRTVEEARMFLSPVGPHKLRSIGISTVGTPWKEGAGHNKPAAPGEPSYLGAATGERACGHPAADFHAVSFSRGGSIWFAREVKNEADGWLSVEIPPAILHAIVEGNSFGIALADESNTGHNNSVYSREQNARAPYLQVSRWKQGAAPASGAKKSVAPAAKKPADRSGEILRAQPAAEAVAPVAMADGAKVRV